MLETHLFLDQKVNCRGHEAVKTEPACVFLHSFECWLFVDTTYFQNLYNNNGV